MLVLTRSHNEGLVCITKDVVIRIILDRDGSRTRVLIDAPKSVRVLRDEAIADSLASHPERTAQLTNEQLRKLELIASGVAS